MNKEIDLRIELKTWGTLFSIQLEIENQEIKQLNYDPTNDLQFKVLEKFKVEDQLDVFIRCKGRQGAEATLTLKANDDSFKETMKCKINRGSCTNEKSFKIN